MDKKTNSGNGGKPPHHNYKNRNSTPYRGASFSRHHTNNKPRTLVIRKDSGTDGRKIEPSRISHQQTTPKRTLSELHDVLTKVTRTHPQTSHQSRPNTKNVRRFSSPKPLNRKPDIKQGSNIIVPEIESG